MFDLNVRFILVGSDVFEMFDLKTIEEYQQYYPDIPKVRK